MLEILVGRANRGKTARLVEKVGRNVRDGVKTIYVVPEQFAVVTEKTLLEKVGNPLSRSCEVMGFVRLADTVFRTLGGAAGSYTDSTSDKLIVSRAVEQARPFFKVYAKAAKKTRFVEAALNFVKEAANYKVDSRVLAAEAQRQNGKFADKLNDLALILASVEAVRGGDLQDPIEAIARAADKLRENDCFGDCDFIFDSFKSFTPAELELVEQILIKGRNVTAAFCCDGLDCSAPIFETAVKTARTLGAIARRNGVEVRTHTLERGLDGFAAGVVSLERLLAGERGAFSADGVRFAAFTDKYGEIDYLCRTVLELLAADKTLRYRDFAVIARDISDYEAAVGAVLPKYRIPYYIGARHSVGGKPLFRAVNAALRLLAFNYRREDVVAFIRSGAAPLERNEADELCAYICAWRLSGRSALHREYLKNPDGILREFTPAQRDALARINCSRSRVSELFLELEEGVKSGLTRDIAQAAYLFAGRLGVQERLERQRQALLEAGRPALAAECAAQFGLFADLLDKMVRFAKPDLGVKTFSELFSMLAAEKDAGSIPTSADEIAFGSADMMRTAGIKYAFVLGFSQGVFPRAVQTNSLVSDAERKKLVDLPLAEPSSNRVFEETFYIYTALTSASRGIYLSCISDGERQRPSYWFGYLADALVQTPYTEDQSPAARLARAHTPETALSCAICAGAGKEIIDFLKGYAGEPFRAAQPAAAIGEQAARMLYGSFGVSPSRIEKFASCPYSYFCRYGLAAKPLKEYELDAAAVGTFMHAVFERSGEALKAGAACDIVAAAAESADALIEERARGGALGQRELFRYHRIKGEAVSFARQIKKELENSDFVPSDFELKISGELSSVRLGGVVDRVDLFTAPDGRVFFRVVDYKTGVKKFKLADLYAGIGLQMPLYMYSLAQSARYGENARPAGVLYSLVRSPAVDLERHDVDPDKLEKKRIVKASGLILSDPDVLRAADHSGKFEYFDNRGQSALMSEAELEQLRKDIGRVVDDIGRDIAAGSVEIRPIGENGASVCRYCEMRPICKKEDDSYFAPRIRCGFENKAAGGQEAEDE